MARKAKTATRQEDSVKTTKETHVLPCPITEVERAEYANKLAECIQDLRALEDERKQVMKSFASRKQDLETDTATLSRTVRSGEVMKSVECELVLNYTRLTATLKRTDTGEVVNERPMTQQERQMDMGFDDESETADTEQ